MRIFQVPQEVTVKIGQQHPNSTTDKAQKKRNHGYGLL